MLTQRQRFHTSTPIAKCGMNNNPAKSLYKVASFIRWAYKYACLHEDSIQEALKNLLNCDRICHNTVLS